MVIFFHYLDSIQRCKEVVDKYSKNFIDLGNDNNPHLEIEDCLAKEKNYKFLLKSNNVLDKSNSRFFNLISGDNSRLDNLGLNEQKIRKIEEEMMEKLKIISKIISNDIPTEYALDEIIMKIDFKRNN